MSCNHSNYRVIRHAEDADDSETRKCNTCGAEFVSMPMLEGRAITGTGRRYGKSIGLPPGHRFRRR